VSYTRLLRDIDQILTAASENNTDELNSGEDNREPCNQESTAADKVVEHGGASSLVRVCYGANLFIATRLGHTHSPIGRSIASAAAETALDALDGNFRLLVCLSIVPQLVESIFSGNCEISRVHECEDGNDNLKNDEHEQEECILEKKRP
jgi:hypothetical protein